MHVLNVSDLGSSGENVRQINVRNSLSQFSGDKVTTQLHTVSLRLTYLLCLVIKPHECWIVFRETWISGLNKSIGPIARNWPKWPSGNRICGLKLPTKLVVWNFRQQTFSCIKQLLTAHPMRSWFWEVICKVTVRFNQFLLMISLISSALYSIWLYDQLRIAPWFELSMT